MAVKDITVDIPEYLTIGHYQKILAMDRLENVDKIINSISVLTGLDIEDIKSYPLDLLVQINNDLTQVMDPKNEFHSIIEWNGQLYGYANLKQASLGEYVDLENLIKDMKGNMHKIAAILYRPIEKHRFDSLNFTVKQKIKMINNKVENVFDWYTIEKYNSDKRKDREELFRDFPVHIFLGAIGFFLTTASLYLNRIQYSQKEITKRTMTQREKNLLVSLSETTGAGGGLFTHSLSPIYYRLQEIRPSST